MGQINYRIVRNSGPCEALITSSASAMSSSFSFMQLSPLERISRGGLREHARILAPAVRDFRFEISNVSRLFGQSTSSVPTKALPKSKLRLKGT